MSEILAETGGFVIALAALFALLYALTGGFRMEG